jgi:hypothetical protein
MVRKGVCPEGINSDVKMINNLKLDIMVLGAEFKQFKFSLKVIQLHNTNTRNSQLCKLIFNFCCLLHVSKILDSEHTLLSTRLLTPMHVKYKGKGKGHPCLGTEALYRPYGP